MRDASLREVENAIKQMPRARVRFRRIGIGPGLKSSGAAPAAGGSARPSPPDRCPDQTPRRTPFFAPARHYGKRFTGAKLRLDRALPLTYRFALRRVPRSSSGLGHQPLTLGTGVRNPYGAPLTIKTANASQRTTAVHHGLFHNIFPTVNAYLAVIDLNPVDEGAETGLAKRDLAGRQTLAHELAERRKL